MNPEGFFTAFSRANIFGLGRREGRILAYERLGGYSALAALEEKKVAASRTHGIRIIGPGGVAKSIEHKIN